MANYIQNFPFSKDGYLRPKIPLASELIAFLELVWQDQIIRFPELRPAFIRFDNLSKSKGYVETRFAGVEYENGQVYHDVLLRKEIINLTTEDLMQALLHSVVHCLNYDRGFIDTRGRSYHTELFKKTAEEVGLTTFWVDGYGYMTKTGSIAWLSTYSNRKTSLRKLQPAKFIEPKGIAI